MSSKKRSVDESSAVKVKKSKTSKKEEDSATIADEPVVTSSFAKLSKKLKKAILETKFGENSELKEMISQLTVMKAEIEHDDDVTKHRNSIACGGLILNRNSSSKAGAETCYTATVNDSDLLGRRRNAKLKHLQRIRYSFNDVLLSVCKSYNFTTVSDELFLEFVIHIITVVMDEVSAATV